MAEHYFTEKQESEDKRFPINVKFAGCSFRLISSSGLFSKDELDSASKLLIENAVVTGKVLDLGCGYGVVGIAILKMKKAKDVFFSDVNERALDLTKDNLKALGLSGKVIKSNLFEKIDEKFDTILSNPPYAAGRKVCFQLIEDSYEHLNEGGSLQIVARHNKGGSVLSEKMNEVFGNVDALVKSGGFRVYRSIKN